MSFTFEKLEKLISKMQVFRGHKQNFFV